MKVFRFMFNEIFMCSSRCLGIRLAICIGSG